MSRVLCPLFHVLWSCLLFVGGVENSCSCDCQSQPHPHTNQSASSVPMDRPNKLISAFQKFDSGNTGRVRTDALKVILTSMGPEPLNQEEIGEFMADADEEGWVDYRKFVNSVIFGT